MEGDEGTLKILAAVDGSDESFKALMKAAELALTSEDYEMAVVHVVEVRDFPSYIGEVSSEQLESMGKDILMDAMEVLTSRGVKATPQLLHGQPVTKILQFAVGFEPEIIVTGSRGMTAAKGALIGSVSSALSKRANCSVLIVR